MRVIEWLRRLFAATPLPPAAEPAPEPAPDPNGPAWCVAANVVDVSTYGPGGSQFRQGAKHFASGAKVYVIGVFWGVAGDKVTVVGHHRKSKRYITIVMSSAHLTNWRAELVYSPHVMAQIEEKGDLRNLPRGGHESKAEVERIVAVFQKRRPSGCP